MRRIKDRIKNYFNVDIDYEKSIEYFNKLIDKDKDIERIYEKIKKKYSERLKRGTLNIKYEKLKIQERQGKLKGSGEDFQFSYFISIFAVLFTFLFQSLFKETKEIVPVVVVVILVVLISELIKKSKSNRSINMTLTISLMVLEELEEEQVKSFVLGNIAYIINGDTIRAINNEKDKTISKKDFEKSPVKSLKILLKRM